MVIHLCVHFQISSFYILGAIQLNSIHWFCFPSFPQNMTLFVNSRESFPNQCVAPLPLPQTGLPAPQVPDLVDACAADVAADGPSAPAAYDVLGCGTAIDISTSARAPRHTVSTHPMG